MQVHVHNRENVKFGCGAVMTRTQPIQTERVRRRGLIGRTNPALPRRMVVALRLRPADSAKQNVWGEWHIDSAKDLGHVTINVAARPPRQRYEYRLAKQEGATGKVVIHRLAICCRRNAAAGAGRDRVSAVLSVGVSL